MIKKLLIITITALLCACNNMSIDSVDVTSDNSSETFISEESDHSQEPTTPSNDDISNEEKKPQSDYLEKEAALMGLWHESPVPPSDYAKRYIFRVNYEFVFLASTMDGEERLREFGGTWSIRDEKLRLEIGYKIILFGGELVPATASTATEFEIVGGVLETVLLDEPEIFELALGEIELDTEYTAYPEGYQNAIMRKIGDDYYWKYDRFYDLDYYILNRHTDE